MSLGCGLCYCYGSVRIHLRSYEAILAVQRRRIAASGTANPMKSLNHATRYTSINRGAFAATLNGCFGSDIGAVAQHGLRVAPVTQWLQGQPVVFWSR